MTAHISSLVETHLDRCTLCGDEPLFSAIDRAGAAPETATMGRAVLIAYLHPEDPEPGTDLALIKQAVAEDVAAADRGEPTDTWTVTDRDGNELGRVWGDTFDTAQRFAEQMPGVRAAARVGGYLLRRLGSNELTTPTDRGPAS